MGPEPFWGGWCGAGVTVKPPGQGMQLRLPEHTVQALPQRIADPNVKGVVGKAHSRGKMNVPECSRSTDWTPVSWRLLGFVTHGWSSEAQMGISECVHKRPANRAGPLHLVLGEL